MARRAAEVQRDHQPVALRGFQHRPQMRWPYGATSGPAAAPGRSRGARPPARSPPPAPAAGQGRRWRRAAAAPLQPLLASQPLAAVASAAARRGCGRPPAVLADQDRGLDVPRVERQARTRLDAAAGAVLGRTSGRSEVAAPGGYAVSVGPRNCVVRATSRQCGSSQGKSCSMSRWPRARRSRRRRRRPAAPSAARRGTRQWSRPRQAQGSPVRSGHVEHVAFGS